MHLSLGHVYCRGDFVVFRPEVFIRLSLIGERDIVIVMCVCIGVCECHVIQPYVL